MSTIGLAQHRPEREFGIAALTGGDHVAFSALFERHRRELLAHAYRMLRSHQDAEDLTQETFLRAWRMRQTYEGRASPRNWLYRIATNAGVDALERRRHNRITSYSEPGRTESRARQLESIADGGSEPDSQVIANETLELVLLTAIRRLPPRPRAMLILKDLLGWSARDIADLLQTTVPSVTSALQRARKTLRTHMPERTAWPSLVSSNTERELLSRLLAATERADASELAELLLGADGRLVSSEH